MSAFSFGGLYMYYFPPAHPRGLPFKQALRELDYGGAFLFIAATILTLTGVNYTTFLPSNNPRVVGLLVSGLVVLLIFAVYETFVPLKQPLTPPRVFTRDHGRELTAPFIAAFVTTMYVRTLLSPSYHQKSPRFSSLSPPSPPPALPQPWVLDLIHPPGTITV